MALLITRQITLTEDNDSGPFYDAYWSTDDGLTYDLAVDGEDLYLPNVGSTAIISVPSSFTTIKLISKGNCTTAFTSGSTSGTTTTTSTTSTSTTSTTTTTTCVPNLDTVTCGYDASSSTTACDGTTIATAHKTGLWLNFDTIVYSSVDGCNITAGWYSPVQGEEGYGYSFYVNVTGDVTNTVACSTSPTTTTTTQEPSYNVGYRTLGNAPIGPIMCGELVGPQLYASVQTFAQVGVGTRIYTNASGTPLVGGNTWFGISQGAASASTKAILIDNGGYVTNDYTCPTTTTTTSTTSATTTTTSTTTQATSCNEYLITCPLGNPTGCQVTYTDCNGVLKSYVQPDDTDFPLCARPTPSVTGGFATFEGSCALTTTTTVPPTTTTTTTTTFGNMWTVVRCDGLGGSYKVSSSQITFGNAFTISAEPGWFTAQSPTTGVPNASITSGIYVDCDNTP